jgi:hypothetical protein
MFNFKALKNDDKHFTNGDLPIFLKNSANKIGMLVSDGKLYKLVAFNGYIQSEYDKFVSIEDALNQLKYLCDYIPITVEVTEI